MLRMNHLLRDRRTALGIGLALIVVLQLASGCSGVSGNDRDNIEPIDSPNQDRALVIKINRSQDDPAKYLALGFEIRDKASQVVLYRQQTHASSRLAWSMRWLDNATVQLSSSDIGTYCWQEQAGGVWIAAHCP